MHKLLVTAAAAMLLSTTSRAAPHADLLAQYAAAASTKEFSAARGQELHTRKFAGGKATTPSCTRCHGQDVRGAGQTLSGKSIKAMALSVTPTRYLDAAKVEKWFKRNCVEVLGRECSAQEKGDWLSYMLAQ